MHWSQTALIGMYKRRSYAKGFMYCGDYFGNFGV